MRTRLMYHAACKVEFQRFKRLYSQLTFFNFKKKKLGTRVRVAACLRSFVHGDLFAESAAGALLGKHFCAYRENGRQAAGTVGPSLEVLFLRCKCLHRVFLVEVCWAIRDVVHWEAWNDRNILLTRRFLVGH